MAKRKTKPELCGWCMEGEKSIEINFDEKKRHHTVFLCAKCFYKSLEKTLGQPCHLIVTTPGNTSSGIVN